MLNVPKTDDEKEITIFVMYSSIEFCVEFICFFCHCWFVFRFICKHNFLSFLVCTYEMKWLTEDVVTVDECKTIAGPIIFSSKSTKSKTIKIMITICVKMKILNFFQEYQSSPGVQTAIWSSVAFSKRFVLRLIE